MMRSSSKAGLFLMELIIVIAFFALASAICIRLFVHSHLVSEHSNNLNMAVNVSQSAAEGFRAAAGDPDRVLALLTGSERSGDEIVVRYDGEWQPSAEEAFRLTMGIARDGAMATGRITVSDADGAPIYSLTVEQYTGSEGS